MIRLCETFTFRRKGYAFNSIMQHLHGLFKLKQLIWKGKRLEYNKRGGNSFNLFTIESRCILPASPALCFFLSSERLGGLWASLISIQPQRASTSFSSDTDCLLCCSVLISVLREALSSSRAHFPSDWALIKYWQEDGDIITWCFAYNLQRLCFRTTKVGVSNKTWRHMEFSFFLLFFFLRMPPRYQRRNTCKTRSWLCGNSATPTTCVIHVSFRQSDRGAIDFSPSLTPQASMYSQRSSRPTRGRSARRRQVPCDKQIASTERNI